MAEARKTTEKSKILDDLDDDYSKHFNCNICPAFFTDAKSKASHENGRKHIKKLNEIKERYKVKNRMQKTEGSENKDLDEYDLYCDVCAKFYSSESYAAHIQGNKHEKNLKKKKLEKKLDMPVVEKTESNSDESNFYCNICKRFCSSSKSYATHMKGREHAKNMKEEKLKKEMDMPNVMESESDSDEDIYCDICKKFCSSYTVYAMHVQGSGHAKNVKKEKLKKKLDRMPEVLKRRSDSEDDDILVKAYAECETCQKRFSGPESFNMHLKSANHLKKVKNLNLENSMKIDEKKNSDDEEINTNLRKKCITCKKTFTGIVPYKIHMQSKLHEKNLMKLKVAEDIKEFYDKTEEGYFCKECKKIFTDILGFQNHLQNNSHEKRKIKDALSEFLKANPEIVFTTPCDSHASADVKDDSDESEAEYFLICKLCKMSFSGPESAHDHIKSKKHISLQKEKEAKKRIKGNISD